MNVSSIYSLDNIQTETKTTSTQVNNEGNSFSSYLSCAKSLEDIFQDAAATYDVPVNLLKAVAKAESNFDPNAVSHCGAQGIMQLMPATASYLGVEDAFDPEQNIMGGRSKATPKILFRKNWRMFCHDLIIERLR